MKFISLAGASASHPDLNSWRLAFIFLLAMVAVDAVGIGLYLPIVPKLLERVTGESISRVSVYGGWLASIYAITSFFAAPLIGGLSDHYGRRPVLLASLAAFGVAYLTAAWASSPVWFFLAMGLAGFFSATTGTANAYISDSVSEEHRARLFGLVNAAFGVGIIVGPIVGGFLVSFGLRIPFVFAGSLAILNAVYGYRALPESLKAQNRRPFAVRKANLIGAIARMRNYKPTLALLALNFLLRLSLSSLPAIWSYYVIEKFGWSAREIGYSFALYGVCVVATQIFILPMLLRRWSNKVVVFTGLGSLSVGYAGMVLAANSISITAFLVPSAISFVAVPALFSILSAIVPAMAQGELQGLLTSANSAAIVLASLIMTQVFRAFTSDIHVLYMPAAPFLLALSISILSCIVATVTFARNAIANK